MNADDLRAVVSVENQRWADIRIPALLDTPAAVRFLSCEPLLGPVDLGIGDPHRDHEADDVHGWPHPQVCLTCSTDDNEVEYFRRRDPSLIDWVITGGESGRGARPMHPDWARSVREQCQAARVPFLFKQWGSWAWPRTPGGVEAPDYVGKKAAGRELDGRTWDEYPEAS